MSNFGGLVVLVVGLLGCAKASPSVQGLREVSGKVLLSRGMPLKGGRIVLRPAGGLRPAVSAEINPDGSFTIDGVSENKPVVPGEYQVFVVFGKDPKHRGLKSQVPKKYQSVSEDESDHFVTIDEDASDLVVKLKRS
jgi:hypothetical protein